MYLYFLPEIAAAYVLLGTGHQIATCMLFHAFKRAVTTVESLNGV